MGRGQQGAWVTHIRPFLEADPILGPMLAAHPERFFIVLTSDHGPCPNFSEKINQDRVARPWIDPSLVDITMLLNEGSTLDGCYNRSKDLTMPTSAHIGLGKTLHCTKQQPDPARR